MNAHLAQIAVKTAESGGLEAACGFLRSGGVVAFPTETVYGVGADATNESAVESLFALKERARNNPVSLHVASADDVMPYVDLSPLAESLVTAFWPGPLTLVVEARHSSCLAPLCLTEQNRVGLRCPRHKQAQALLRAFGKPVAGTSANLSGDLSPTSPQHVLQAFSGSPQAHLMKMILAAGKTDVGLESTVLELGADSLIIRRLGAISIEEIQAATGLAPLLGEGVSGVKKSRLRHRLRCDVLQPDETEAYLAFGPTLGTPSRVMLNLSEQGDLSEAARHFFAALKELDARDDISGIAVAPLPTDGVGMALNARLKSLIS